MALEDQMQAVQNSYKRRVKEGEQATLKIWKGYKSEKEKLVSWVSVAFQKVLNEVGPVITGRVRKSNPDAERSMVEEYTVEYCPQWNEFKINIDKISLCTSPEDCPHIYLGPITGFGDERHPKIKEFMKEYHVRRISNPDNYCSHK